MFLLGNRKLNERFFNERQVICDSTSDSIFVSSKWRGFFFMRRAKKLSIFLNSFSEIAHLSHRRVRIPANTVYRRDVAIVTVNDNIFPTCRKQFIVPAALSRFLAYKSAPARAYTNDTPVEKRGVRGIAGR